MESQTAEQFKTLVDKAIAATNLEFTFGKVLEGESPTWLGYLYREPGHVVSLKQVSDDTWKMVAQPTVDEAIEQIGSLDELLKCLKKVIPAQYL